MCHQHVQTSNDHYHSKVQVSLGMQNIPDMILVICSTYLATFQFLSMAADTQNSCIVYRPGTVCVHISEQFLVITHCQNVNRRVAFTVYVAIPVISRCPNSYVRSVDASDTPGNPYFSSKSAAILLLSRNVSHFMYIGFK